MTDILPAEAVALPKTDNDTAEANPLDALRIDPEAVPPEVRVASRTVLGNGAVLEHLA